MKKTLAISAAISLPLFAWWWASFGIPLDHSALGTILIVSTFLNIVAAVTALVDAARVPRHEWEQRNLSKTLWIVLIMVGGILGAIAYVGWIRRRFMNLPALSNPN